MKINSVIRIAAVVALAALTGSCGIYKKYSTPEDTEVVKAYKEARTQELDSTQLGNLQWEDVFTDPILAGYIRRALANNTNLANAKLNVDIARANVLGARLSYLPSVVLAPNGAGASYAGGPLSWSYTIPAQASWEIDIFGKTLNNKRASEAQLRQTQAYEQAVRSQIIAGVANTYYTLCALHAQVALSRRTSELWLQTTNTMADLKEAGRGITEAAVVQSRANYYSILANIESLEGQIASLNNVLSLLMNEMVPVAWETASSVELEVPVAVRKGVPMIQLANRPDVYAAEQTLAAAYYNTSASRAAFYPGLTISFSGGFTNLLGNMVRNPGDWFYQLAGSLAAPLFSRGQNIARLKGAKAQQQQAFNNFQYAILNAASEVDDAIGAYNTNTAKLTYLNEQVHNLELSVEYTQDLLMYSTGTTNYLEVLTAQQSLLGAQTGVISTQLSRAQAIISLYQTMGGGR